MAGAANSLPLAWEDFRAGQRIAVAVSGGADSVALLRSLAAQAAERGLVLRVAHVNHGLRGAESDADEQFVCALAAQLGLPMDTVRVDTGARVAARGESVEQAARELRYGFLRGLLQASTVDTIATAHTLDDQAETVLLKLLRGAWTDGLGGISPVVAEAHGRIVRPMLQIRRAQVEAYLLQLGQSWRDDSSNLSAEFTRNRVRHQLLPLLREFNPNIAEQLARLAQIARDEEQHWQRETDRLLPALLLAGKPVRGGGRSVGHSEEPTTTLDAARLLSFDAATQRRLLRAAGLRLGVRADFDETAQLLRLLHGKPQRGRVGNSLQVERTPRELRLSPAAAQAPAQPLLPVECAVPGETLAAAYGLRVVAEAASGQHDGNPLTLRVWRAGDRVRLRHTLSDAKVKEVLQRMRLSPDEKSRWPVLVWAGRVVWLQGCEVQRSEDMPTFEIYEVTGSASEPLPEN